MPDYAKLIDAETWAFIERTNSFYPPDTSNFTMAQHREVYDAMCRAFHYPYPSGVTAFDSEVPAPDAQDTGAHLPFRPACLDGACALFPWRGVYAGRTGKP